MDIYQIVSMLVLVLHVTHVLTKSKSKSRKKYQSYSEEDSIENLLYYKDCQRKGKDEPTAKPEPMVRYEPPPPPPPPPPPRQPECPFPKMCCALTCGNECGGNGNGNSNFNGNNQGPAFVNRQMEQPIQTIQPISQLRQPGMGAVQPQIIQRRKKKLKYPPNKMQLPSSLSARRDFSGLTKEKIKSLISHDDDIRKILKDLVRVTMQKVDLLDMLHAKADDDADQQREQSPVDFDDEE